MCASSGRQYGSREVIRLPGYLINFEQQQMQRPPTNSPWTINYRSIVDRRSTVQCCSGWTGSGLRQWRVTGQETDALSCRADYSRQ